MVAGLWGLLVIAGSAMAQEPLNDAELSRHLTVVRTQIADVTIDPIRREQMALDMAATLDRAAQAVTDPEVRRHRWALAIDLLDRFSRENPELPLARQLRFQAAVLPLGPGPDLAPCHAGRAGRGPVSRAGDRPVRRRDRAIACGVDPRRSHDPGREPAVPPGTGPGRSSRPRAGRLRRAPHARGGGADLAPTGGDRGRAGRLLASAPGRPRAPGGGTGRGRQGARRGGHGQARAPRARPIRCRDPAPDRPGSVRRGDPGGRSLAPGWTDEGAVEGPHPPGRARPSAGGSRPVAHRVGPLPGRPGTAGRSAAGVEAGAAGAGPGRDRARRAATAGGLGHDGGSLPGRG